MKRNLLILTALCAIVCSSLMLTGCNSSSSNNFGITYAEAYVLQTDLPSEAKFLPYVWFFANGEMNSGSITGPTGIVPGALYINDLIYAANESTSLYRTLAEINGSYTLVSTSKEGQQYTLPFSINVSSELGQMTVTSFQYQANSNYLSATVSPVTGATHYGLAFIPETQDGENHRFNRMTTMIPVSSSTTNDIAVEWRMNSVLADYQNGTVCVVAMKQSNSGNIILESQHYNLERSTSAVWVAPTPAPAPGN